jgi:hypothetical protein
MIRNFVKIFTIIILFVLLCTVFTVSPGLQKQFAAAESSLQVKAFTTGLTGTVSSIFDDNRPVALPLVNNNAEANTATVRSDISEDAGLTEPVFRRTSVLHRQINPGRYLVPLYLINQVILN